jgi:hypothetical protein
MPAATLDWQQGDTEDATDDEDTAEPAFGMLETVREYARERLAAADPAGATER